MINPKVYSLALVLAVFCTRHVRVLPDLTVPAWLLVLVTLAAIVAAAGWLVIRKVRGFRSAPYPRIVPHWSAYRPSAA